MLSNLLNGRLRELPHFAELYALSPPGKNGEPSTELIDENGEHHEISTITWECLYYNKPFPKVCEACSTEIHGMLDGNDLYRGYYCVDRKKCKERVRDQKELDEMKYEVKK